MLKSAPKIFLDPDPEADDFQNKTAKKFFVVQRYILS